MLEVGEAGPGDVGNSVDESPWLSVGVTYLPIAISGAMMLLFVIERLTIIRRRPEAAGFLHCSRLQFCSSTNLMDIAQ
jgi:hypothetical protein